jgi:hypothetical protein
MRALALALAMLCAPVARADPVEVLRGFGQALYRIGETTGGSPAEWDRLEARTLAALGHEPAASLGQANEKGRTPLMIAAANGYGFAVKWLLTKKAVLATLDARDDTGLTAHDLARIALRQTAFACRPKAENPVVLVPLLVGLPYYLDRQPYPMISDALAAAGAGQGDAELRAYWLNACPDAAPDLRDTIAGDAPVQIALLRGARDVLMAKCSEDARLRHRSIERMFGGRADAAGVIAQSEAQMQAKIADCADEVAGFLPD